MNEMKTRLKITKLMALPKFLAWIKTQRGAYNYTSNDNCPVARYIRLKLKLDKTRISVGGGHITIREPKGPWLYTVDYDCRFEAVLMGDTHSCSYFSKERPPLWTYPLLAKRVKALIEAS